MEDQQNKESRTGWRLPAWRFQWCVNYKFCPPIEKDAGHQLSLYDLSWLDFFEMVIALAINLINDLNLVSRLFFHLFIFSETDYTSNFDFILTVY